MVSEDDKKSPDLSLEPSKETLKEIPKHDRFAYAGIIALLLFVLYIINFYPMADFDATFWIVMVVILVVGVIVIANIIARREKP